MYRSRDNLPELKAIRSGHTALAILRLLQRETSYRLNDRLLRDYLQVYALDGTRADLLSALESLEHDGLIAKDEVAPDIQVVELTEKGFDVAQGKEISSQVLKPWPDCPY